MSNIDDSFFKKPEVKSDGNSIEDILGQDEKILVRLKPNPKLYRLEAILKMLPMALLWAAIDFGIIFGLIFGGAFNQEPGLLWFLIPFFLVHLAPVWIYIANLVKRFNELKRIEYVLTDKRVIKRSGFIGINVVSIFYNEINSVQCHVGILDRLFKVGDLMISSNIQHVVFEDIEDPYFYVNKIQEITTDLKADIYYPNDLRPETNHGYNTKYKK